MEKKDTEAEIVARYSEGWSLSKIQSEYELTAFELAYILGKHKVPARIKNLNVGSDTTFVDKNSVLRILVKIVRELGLVKGQKIRFAVLSREKLSLTLQILNPG
jgi:hypothetical protein